MKKVIAYDLPTRVFHTIFALLFIIAFFIGKNVDDDDPFFAYHMLAGFTIVFVLILRIVWGFVGSKYARFSSFKLNPKDLISYFTGMFSSGTKRYLSHNPASSFAAIAMMALAIGLGISGYLMVSTGNKDAYEDVHELMANGFMFLVIAHIVGIIVHSIRHSDRIWMSMIDGTKEDVPGEEGIRHSYTLAGSLFILITMTWAFYLSSNYDSQTGSLALFGNELQLTEQEENESGKMKKEKNRSRKSNRDHNDDEDDD